MSQQEFIRKQKEDKPVLAICYDFDKTLSPNDMQAQGFLEAVGYPDDARFWRESNAMAEENGMDQNLAYMYKMREEAAGRVLFTKQTLREYGQKVRLFPGVEEWFGRMRRYGEEHGVIVEHYIISSGLKEMIEGTSVAHEFERIYANAFYFNEKGEAAWPAQMVNYTNKTQFLFRIEKGVLAYNDPGINELYAPENIRVPFRNMVYIGDSDTDVPCMKLVNSYGGHSIGVYNAETGDKAKVYKMMREGRIKYFAPADYNDGRELDTLLKSIIRRTAENEALEAIHYESKHDLQAADSIHSQAERRRTDLIIALENSRSFATTHSILHGAAEITGWTAEERKTLLAIGASNSQVFYILSDPDVRRFYQPLLDTAEAGDSSAAKIREKISEKEQG